MPTTFYQAFSALGMAAPDKSAFDVLNRPEFSRDSFLLKPSGSCQCTQLMGSPSWTRFDEVFWVAALTVRAADRRTAARISPGCSGCAVLSPHRGCTWRQPLGRIPRRIAAPPCDLPCHIDIWTDKTHDSGRWSGEVNTVLRDDVDSDTLDVFPA
jgi:hypothetical protein